jgi:hypothetical protein
MVTFNDQHQGIIIFIAKGRMAGMVFVKQPLPSLASIASNSTSANANPQPVPGTKPLNNNTKAPATPFDAKMTPLALQELLRQKQLQKGPI